MGSKYKTTFTYNDKRYQIYASSKAELNKKKIEKIQELKDGELSSKNPTVEEWALYCIKTYKINLKPNTLVKYKNRMKNLVKVNIFLQFYGNEKCRFFIAINLL